MLAEITLAQRFLINKFGTAENVPMGVYAIPTGTSKGKAFMRVEITQERGMIDFSLFKDESLTESWHD